MDVRIELRKKDFKKTFEDPRRRREEQQVQIRRQKREELINAKRKQALADMDLHMIQDSSTDAPAFEMDSSNGTEIDLSKIPMYFAALMSNNETDQFNACQQFRRLLSIEKNPPIEQIIDANVVPRLIEFLKYDTRPDLQFEAAWALTNVASGTQAQTKVVIEHGALPLLVRLLNSSRFDIREQAVWALGNIAGDCSELRNKVFTTGGLEPLLIQLNAALEHPEEQLSMLKNATWTLSNLCRGKPKPLLDWIMPALPVLHGLIYSTDLDVLTDACWALSYLTDGNDELASQFINAILKYEMASRLVQLLLSKEVSIKTPALRAVGNIVSGNEDETQAMISVGCVPALRPLIGVSQKLLQKEACWTISNIMAGTPGQIQEVIENNIVPMLVELSLARETEFEVRKEVHWALANAASGALPQQIFYLVQQDILSSLSLIITENTESKLVATALEGIYKILKAGEQVQRETAAEQNPYVVLLDEARGFPALENMQFEQQNTRQYNWAMKIMKTFIEHEEQECDDSEYETFGMNSKNTVLEQSKHFNFQGEMES